MYYYLDGTIPCKIIYHEHVTGAYRLIELENGNRMEVPTYRLKKHKNQPTDSPHDILCPNCGKLSRYRTVCEHCESPITSSSSAHIKKAFNKNIEAFYYIGGKLFYFDSFHTEFLEKFFKIPEDWSAVLTNIFPRGRIYEGYRGNAVIGLSESLRSKQQEIANDIDITALDRPEWIYSDAHYNTSKQEMLNTIIHNLKFKYVNWPDAQVEEFLEQYAPDILDGINRYVESTELAVASSWLSRMFKS